MNAKSLLVLALIFMLIPIACSPSTIANSSVEQTAPEVETLPGVAAEEPNLISVEHVEVQVGVGSPIPVEIVASGTWPDLCAQIAETKSQMNGFKIDVTVLASTSESCPPDHLGLPFTYAFPLNMAELPAGMYTITVNGTSTTFEWPVKTDLMTGSISGWVWHDSCLPGLDGQPAPTSTPPGCIEQESAPGIYHANSVLDPNESPIESIVVILREGDCTTTSLTGIRDRVMTLGSDLSYTFTGLNAGTYCVSIDPLADPNFALLIPGVWSHPYVADGLMAQTITLGAGENRLDVNFGWDHQFK